MPTQAEPCPDAQILDDLLAGRLSAAQFAELEAHVFECTACGALIAHLALSTVKARSGPGTGLRTAGLGAALPDAGPLPGFAPISPAAPAATSPGAGFLPAFTAAPTAAAPAALAPGFPAEPSFALIDRDRFEIVRQIARGGMGRVVEAWDHRHGRTVALKTLLHPDAAGRARFAREARITGSLQHPGIVPLYETGRWSDDEPFIAMKLVRGRPLDQVVAETARRDRVALVPNVIAMTEALAYAHEKGVIHRDLKPANVLLGSFGETVVIDWGLAKAVGDPTDTDEASLEPDADPLSASATLTRVGVAMGTPYYMPPEQARGERVDARADVYSLGALLYHVLAGSPPYRGPGDVIARVLAGPPEPLRERVPWLAPDLLAIVEKAMSRAPAERYPDARAMAEDLRRFEAGKLVAAHTYSLGTLFARWVARHRGVVAMAMALVVAVGLTAGLSIWRVVRERDRADDARVEADRQRATALTQRDAAEDLVGSFLINENRGMLEMLGKLDYVYELGGRVESYYRRLDPSNAVLDARALRRRASALDIMVSVATRRRDIGSATVLASEALTVRIAQSARDAGDVSSMADVAMARAVVADLTRQTFWRRAPTTPPGVFEQVDAYLQAQSAAEGERAATAARAIEALPNAPAWTRVAVGWVRATLALTAANRSDLARARGLATEAGAALASAGDFRTLDATWRSRFAQAHCMLAEAGLRIQEWPVVLDHLGACIEERRDRRRRAPDDPVNLDRLAAALGQSGSAHEMRREAPEALAADREALELERTAVARDPENRWMAEALGGTLVSLCRLEREWDGPGAAGPHCREAGETSERLVSDMKDNDPSGGHAADAGAWNLRAQALQAAGEAALAEHRAGEARDLFQAAVDASRSALGRDPKSREAETGLADCLRDLGRAENALGRPGLAQARYHEALAVEEPYLAASSGVSDLVSVGELWVLLGDAARGDEARAAYVSAVTLLAQAHEAAPEDLEPALFLAKASRKLAATEHDAEARSELARRASAVVAPHAAAGRVSPEWRAELATARR